MAVEKLAKVWPEWRVEKQLGKGSYGVVYKVIREDNNLKSHAAVKVISIPTDESEIDSLRSEGLSEEGAKTYFQGIVNDFVGEIRLMDSLKGVQNIVSVEDYKVVENQDGIGWDIFIRMELLTPFNTYICNKQMTESDVIKLGVDICTALEICGQRNIVHRDIKPENIFINDFGYFKLGDFGIARKLENATGGMSQKGTFNYMAPEVATGTSYDARVDIYSLGIVLYRLLNGNRLPFIENEQQLQNPNERKLAVERRIRGERMKPPCNASAQVAAVIMRACAYNPQARFANATQMKEALMRASIGAYREETDLDKTVSVRHAAADVNSTVYVTRPSVTQSGSNGRAPVQTNYPGSNTASRSYAPSNQNVNRTSPSGNFAAPNQNLNRTSPSGNFQQNPNRTNGNPLNRTNGTMGTNAALNRTGTVTIEKKNGLCILCLLSLFACLLPFGVDLLVYLEIVTDNLLLMYGIELACTFVPMVMAVAGKAVAQTKNLKGTVLSLIAVLLNIALSWLFADMFFTECNTEFIDDPTTAAIIHISYFAVFAILSVVLYLLAGRKKKS